RRGRRRARGRTGTARRDRAPPGPTRHLHGGVRVVVRLVLGLAITLAVLAVAGRRAFQLYRIGRTGQPVEPGRTSGVGKRVLAVTTEVLGQRKLLKWSVPGVAHSAVFWGFTILLATIIEGFGALFDRDFHIPIIGTMAWLGFLE